MNGEGFEKVLETGDYIAIWKFVEEKLFRLS